MGESKPGDVGDSKGTFHDRAGHDNNVIIDGEAQSYEDYKKNQQTNSSKSTSKTKSKQQNRDANRNQSNVASSGQYAELDGEVVEVEVDRISGSGNPIATYRGIHVHVPNGSPGETYNVKLTAQSGYFIGETQIDE